MHRAAELIEQDQPVAAAEDDRIPVRRAVMKDLDRRQPLLSTRAAGKPYRVIRCALPFSGKIGNKIIAIGGNGKR